MMGKGPTKIETWRCEGCDFLHLQDWEFHEEDDGIDRGTDATCTAAKRPIASYWNKTMRSPDWCPFAKPGDADADAPPLQAQEKSE